MRYSTDDEQPTSPRTTNSIHVLSYREERRHGVTKYLLKVGTIRHHLKHEGRSCVSGSK